MISLLFAAQVKYKCMRQEKRVYTGRLCSVADYIVCDIKLMYFI